MRRRRAYHGKPTAILRSSRRQFVLLALLAALQLAAFGAENADEAELVIVPNCQGPMIADDGDSFVGLTHDPLARPDFVHWDRDAGVTVVDVDYLRTQITDVSSDATVATGYYQAGHFSGSLYHYRAYRWTLEGGVETLPHFYEVDYARYEVSGISGDGLTVVGGQSGATTAATEPLVWNGLLVSALMRPFPSPFDWGSAVATSETGDVVYGWLTEINTFGFKEFYRWTEATGTVVLPTPLPIVSNNTMIDAIPENHLILGYANFADGWHSYLTSDGTNISILPNPSSGIFQAWALADDASVVLGNVGFDPPLDLAADHRTAQRDRPDRIDLWAVARRMGA